MFNFWLCAIQKNLLYQLDLHPGCHMPRGRQPNAMVSAFAPLRLTLRTALLPRLKYPSPNLNIEVVQNLCTQGNADQ